MQTVSTVECSLTVAVGRRERGRRVYISERDVSPGRAGKLQAASGTASGETSSQVCEIIK